MGYFSIEAQLVDIVQTAMNANFTTLVTAIGAADLTSALKAPGQCTVFAPNNAAFAKLNATMLADLLKPENKANLAGLLKYHIINGSLTSAQILNMTLPMNVTTLQGSIVTVSKNGNDLMVNNAKVIQADVMATNGIIHVIDTVLMPPASLPATTTLKPSNSAAYLRGNQQFFSVLVFTILFPFLRF